MRNVFQKFEALKFSLEFKLKMKSGLVVQQIRSPDRHLKNTLRGVSGTVLATSIM